jgi:hypothetical protein
MTPSRNTAIAATIATALIIAASFMPWGELRGAIDIQSPFGDDFRFMNDALNAQFAVTVTAWNGTLTLGGLKLPNWLVVVAAVAVAAFCWLKATGTWPAPRWLSLLLVAYGVLHTLFFTLTVAFNGTAGVGALLTILGFIALLVILLRDPQLPATAPLAPTTAA